MAERTSLKDYQRELAARLRPRRRAAAVHARRAGRRRSLAGRPDGGGRGHPGSADHAGPAHASWFKGLANIRGNLYSVVDFPAFLRRRPVVNGDQARLLLFGERFRLGAALLVDRALGLRSPAQLERKQAAPRPWARAHYADEEGRLWKELDLSALAQHPDFLGVGA